MGPAKVNNVPVFQPFRGLRYCGQSRNVADLSAVVAPPYDVIHGNERESLEAMDPNNAVRLILPQASADGDGYATAAALLARWRGPSYGGVPSSPAVAADASHWEELRLGALEDRIAADLALGRHAELLARGGLYAAMWRQQVGEGERRRIA